MPELVVIPNQNAMSPVISIEQAIERAELLRGYVSAVMKKGRDYGVIPGTERKPNADGTPSRENNVLLQPGAERLCTLFGLVDEYEDAGSIIDIEHGFFHFSFKCILLRNASREMVDGKAVTLGQVVGVAIGSANSREKKYRRGGKSCPECGAIAIKKSKFPPRDQPQGRPGWYCYDKAGGCGKEFAFNDPDILNAKQTDNVAESFDLINTLQKIAEKRAKLAAVRAATNASDFFNSEDGEDHKPDDEPEDDWVKIAADATDADELNDAISHWKDIPKEDRTAFDTQVKATAKALGLVFSKAQKKWEAPASKPETAQKPTQYVSATQEQLDEIDAILPKSGLSQAEALAGHNGAAGGQITSLMQLTKEQAAAVLNKLDAAMQAKKAKS